MDLDQVEGPAIALLHELQTFAREWSGPLRQGALLHHDGETLWLVSQSGEREALLEQAAVSASSLAVSEHGTHLALSAFLAPDDAQAASAVLYLVTFGEGAQLIDAVNRDGSISSPTFMRPPAARPTAGHAAERAGEELYWIRSWEAFDSHTQRVLTEVVRWGDGERSIVEVPLRHGESILRLDAYSGSDHLTVTLVRRLGFDPSLYEVLANHDDGPFGAASLNQWSIFTTRGNTDAFLNVAWLAPDRYAVPIHLQREEMTVSFEVWRVYCGHLGPEVVGPHELDWGYEHSWDVLAIDDHRLLVLRRDDLENLEIGRDTVHWHVIDTTAGVLASTPIRWQPGPWVVAREPATEVERPDDC